MQSGLWRPWRSFARVVHQIARIPRPTSHAATLIHIPYSTAALAKFTYPLACETQPAGTALEQPAPVQLVYLPESNKGPSYTLHVSVEALKKLGVLVRDPLTKDKILSIAVEFGGCHGFQYKFKLIERPQIIDRDQHQADSPLFKLVSDTKDFQLYRRTSSREAAENSPKEAAENTSRKTPQDALFFVVKRPPGLMLSLDETSMKMMAGSKLDYTSELIGSQFKILDNPNADNGCGCGVSFGLKP
jgi:iron-sulfur cluster assembly 2